MDELLFKKLICRYGCEPVIVHRDEPNPRICPHCKRRFDMRFTVCIPCTEDGSVPGQETIQETVQETVEETGKQYTESIESSETSEKLPHRRHRGYQATEAPRTRAYEEAEVSEGGFQYRRRSHQEPAASEPVAFRHRSFTDSMELEQQGRISNYNSRDERSEPFSLRCGSFQIQIPPQGGSLGRMGFGSEVLAANSLVSRNHATIGRNRLGKVEVRDNDSLNGTYVDTGDGRRRIGNQELVELNYGDRIWLADQLFVIERS